MLSKNFSSRCNPIDEITSALSPPSNLFRDVEYILAIRAYVRFFAIPLGCYAVETFGALSTARGKNIYARQCTTARLLSSAAFGIRIHDTNVRYTSGIPRSRPESESTLSRITSNRQRWQQRQQQHAEHLKHDLVFQAGRAAGSAYESERIVIN